MHKIIINNANVSIYFVYKNIKKDKKHEVRSKK